MDSDSEDSRSVGGGVPLPKSVETFNERLNSILTVVGLAMFALMILAVCFQLLVRWITAPYLGINVPWTGALAQLTLVWVTLFGAALASRDNDHIKIDFFKMRLPNRARRGTNVIISLTVIAFLLVFVYGSLTQYSAVLGRQFHTLPRMAPFTREWFYVVAFAASILMIGYSTRDIVATWRDQGG